MAGSAIAIYEKNTFKIDWIILDGAYNNNDFLYGEEENHHPVVIETNEEKKHVSVQ